MGPVKKCFKIIEFIYLMAVEFVPPLIQGIMYASMGLDILRPFIPFVMSDLSMTILGMSCVLTHLFGGICFIGFILLQKLGFIAMNAEQSVNDAYYKALQQQIEATNEINTRLGSYNDFSSKDFYSYAKLAKILNQNIVNLKENYPDYKKSFFSKLFIGPISFFTVLSSVSSSLLLSAGILHWCTGSTIVLGSAFVATMPLAVGLLSLAFLPGILYVFYLLRGLSTAKTLDPLEAQHGVIKEKLQNFKEKKGSEFDKIYDEKKKNKENKKIAQSRSSLVNYMQSNPVKFHRDECQRRAAAITDDRISAAITLANNNIFETRKCLEQENVQTLVQSQSCRA